MRLKLTIRLKLRPGMDRETIIAKLRGMIDMAHECHEDNFPADVISIEGKYVDYVRDHVADEGALVDAGEIEVELED